MLYGPPTSLPDSVYRIPAPKYILNQIKNVESIIISVNIQHFGEGTYI